MSVMYNAYRQCYREAGRTAGSPSSVTVCATRRVRELASALLEEWSNISQQKQASLVPHFALLKDLAAQVREV